MGSLMAKRTTEQYREHAARYLAMPGNRTKLSARQKAQYAIRTGKIVRGPCEVCGDPKTEAHHDDYTKPLEVRWLCQAHHVDVHRDDSRPNGNGWLGKRHTHCQRGHEFTPDNIKISAGKRQCRTCQNLTSRRRYAEQHQTIRAGAQP